MMALVGVARMDEQASRTHQSLGLSSVLGFDVVVAWRQSPETWRSAVEGWLAFGSVNTRSAYATALKQFLMHLGCTGDGRSLYEEVTGAQLWRVTTADIRAWQHAMKAARLSPATINSKVAAVSSFFRFCQEQVVFVDQAHEIHAPLLTMNPAATAPRLTVSHSPKVSLSMEQVRALLQVPSRKTVPGRRTYALLLAYLLTGQQTSDIRTLRWGEIRREGDTVLYHWQGSGKSGEEHLHPAVYAAITAYLQATGRLRTIGPDEYIFTPLDTEVAWRFGYRQVRENSPISRQRVNQIVKAAARRAGLRADLITAQSLRRTAARRYYDLSGYDLDETAKMLHHSSVATTRVYLSQPEWETSTSWRKYLTV